MPGDRPPIEGAVAVTQASDTLSAAGVVGLEQETERVVGAVAVTVAEHVMLQDANLRKRGLLPVRAAMAAAGSQAR